MKKSEIFAACNKLRMLPLGWLAIHLLTSTSPSIAQVSEAREGEFRAGILMKWGVPHEIKYKVKDGLALYQDDVELGTVAEMDRKVALHTNKDISLAQVAADARWPGGVVTYEIDINSFPSSIRTQVRQDIESAISHWRQKTVIRFVKSSTEFNRVIFKYSDEGFCRSTSIGFEGGVQVVKMPKGKCGRNTLVHEIGHVVGLFHEHTRCDRDKYININWPNVTEPEQFHRECALGFWRDPFSPDASRSGPYDYASVMHYPAYAFAKDKSVKTIIAPKPLRGIDLSAGDIEAINALYVKWSENKKVPNHASPFPPALVFFDNQLHMLSVDDDDVINLSTWDGSLWNERGSIRDAEGVALRTSKDTGVSAAVHEGKLSVAFSGYYHQPTVATWSGNENVWRQRHALFDGDKRAITYRAPAVTSFKNRLYMVYVGENGSDLYYTSEKTTSGGLSFEKPLRLPVQRSRMTPSLAVFGNKLHMVHRALSADAPFLYHSTFDGLLWSPNKKIGGQASAVAPSIAVFDNRMHIVHTHSNPLNTNIYYSFYGPDGTWRPDVTIRDQQSKAAVGLAASRNRLHMVHLGKSENQLWHSWLDPLHRDP